MESFDRSPTAADELSVPFIRKGLLMGALVDEARASGKHAMIAAIDGVNFASIQFHERLGFVQVARMPEVGAKFGRWQDLVLMQLRLDERTAPDDP